MLAADVAGQPYNKAEHNRELQARIERSRSSIELKHQTKHAVRGRMLRAEIERVVADVTHNRQP